MLWQAVEPLVDLDRYPIHEPAALATRELVERCSDRVERTGACELPDFLRADAVRRIAAACAAAAPEAHRHEGRSTPYLELPDEGWPEAHPRRRWDAYALAALAYDRVPEELRAIYAWDPLREFVRAVLGLPELHRYADPLGCCSVNVFAPGDQQNWHFDHTDFVVSIPLRSGERGGDFLCTAKIRTPEAEHYDAVAAVLDGDESGVARIPMRPGALLIFQGRYSLHRVSRVEGGALRLTALLSYDTKPGTCASPLLQQARYGRIERPPGEASA